MALVATGEETGNESQHGIVIIEEGARMTDTQHCDAGCKRS